MANLREINKNQLEWQISGMQKIKFCYDIN
jgi:hypothetical protein